jgi:hypothetical protein
MQAVMSPFQGFRFVGGPIPRALPWAVIFSAFQADAYQSLNSQDLSPGIIYIIVLIERRRFTVSTTILTA